MQGKKKTHIMYETSLTYPQTVRYLEYLNPNPPMDRDGRREDSGRG